MNFFTYISQIIQIWYFKIKIMKKINWANLSNWAITIATAVAVAVKYIMENRP